MADLFDSSDEHIVQCIECRRPILRTRFVNHALTCGKGGVCRSDDSEMALVIAPYGLVDQPSKPIEKVSMGSIRRGGGSKRRIPLEEDTWERDLETLSTPYVPRGKSRKRRRMPLSTETTGTGVGQRKRSIERKAMQVAMQAGVAWSGGGVEPLRALATKWTDRAPWAKLMQIAMPVVVARTPKRRKEDGVLMVRGLGKVDIPERPPPSLVGSLMYLRGLGMRELANTALGSIDSPQAATGRPGAVFHGQTYVAELGTFATDPRAQTTIKMPLTVASEVPTKPGTKKGGTGKASGAGSSGGPGSGTKKQKVPKGQRGAGNQQGQGGAHGSGKVSTPRKSGGARAAAGAAGNAKGGANSQDSQQQRGNIGRATAGINASAAVSNASAAAVTKFASLQHPAATQKKAYRQQIGAVGVTGAMQRVGSAQSLPSGSMAGGVPLAGNIRSGNKGRQMATPVGSTPLSGARQPGNAKITKSPSPSQASSRSGDRLAIHRGSPMSAAMYGPHSLVPSVGQVPVTVNRTTGVRVSQPKAHLDFQVMAQVSAQGGLIPGASLGNSNTARAAMQQTAAKGNILGDKIGGQIARMPPNIRGMPPQARGKPNAIPQNVQARLAAAAAQRSHQPRQQAGLGQLRKEERDLLQKSAPDLEAQLRRADKALPPELIAGKQDKVQHSIMFGKHADRRGMPMNHGLQGNPAFLGAPLDAATSPMGTNPTLNASQQQQANLAFMRLAHQKHLNAAAAAANPAAAQNMMQNLHDIRSLQNMGMVPGIQQNAAARNANMLNFLQATGLGAGGTNAGAMPNPGMGPIPANAIPTGPNPMMGQDALFQQILSSQAALAPNAAAAALHSQHLGAQTGGMNQSHQVGRTGPMAPMAPGGPAVVQPPKKADLDEINRALELSFDESDLLD
eukprot:GFKZ01002435.1.p1 GENE.GFKZ01002435.1~~GFKZ01002435.1.p1  ORF type:complete len:1045 (+),score=146.15 GFKZ01002435.1:422-3136(+)